jgi:hypothetical protein
MIPAIALMIAVYGSARLLNDGFKRHPGNSVATVFTWFVSAIGILILVVLALMVNSQGASAPSM